MTERVAQNVPKGLYRNTLGAELEVVGAATQHTIGVRTLAGDIAIAKQHDDLFGTWTYLVTAASLADCGYELIKAADDD